MRLSLGQCRHEALARTVPRASANGSWWLMILVGAAGLIGGFVGLVSLFFSRTSWRVRLFALPAGILAGKRDYSFCLRRAGLENHICSRHSVGRRNYLSIRCWTRPSSRKAPATLASLPKSDGQIKLCEYEFSLYFRPRRIFGCAQPAYGYNKGSGRPASDCGCKSKTLTIRALRVEI